MCGWVAVFGRSPTSLEQLTRSASSMASRGPDGHGVDLRNGMSTWCGMGHRRLAILDPTPAGAQPMRDEASGCSIVYNGEIYNSPELRRELQSEGVTFRSTCDTEVILQGWIRWGDRVVDRLHGIFSLALFDERDGRALLVRDRLGVKPLYWALDGERLIAGSAPRAILEIAPGLGADVDRVALAQFLCLLWIPHPRTPWEAIKKLPPAHVLAFAGGKVEARAYGAPAAEATKGPLSAEELQSTLDTAVERQLLSDVPVGLLLSGGLDSTLLLALMDRHYAGDRMTGVCVHFTDGANRFETVPEDLQYARRAAAAVPRLELREVSLGRQDWKLIDELAPHFDDPVADPAALAMYLLAKASDAKVVLSGVGGEELFAGYPRHLALRRARTIAAMPAPVRQTLGVAARGLRGAQPGPAFAVRRNLEKLGRAVGGRAKPHYWRMMSQLRPDQLRGLMPDVADAALGELDAISPALSATDTRAALAFDSSQFLSNLNLAYTDKASMAGSVEVRVPLLDEAVVAAALRTRPDDLIRNGVQKAILKGAARGLIDDEILDRPKAGLGGPIRAWVQGEAGGFLAERVEGLVEADMLEKKAARAIVSAARAGRSDSGLAVWAMACLDVWSRTHGPRSGKMSSSSALGVAAGVGD